MDSTPREATHCVFSLARSQTPHAHTRVCALWRSCSTVHRRTTSVLACTPAGGQRVETNGLVVECLNVQCLRRNAASAPWAWASVVWVVNEGTTLLCLSHCCVFLVRASLCQCMSAHFSLFPPAQAPHLLIIDTVSQTVWTVSRHHCGQSDNDPSMVCRALFEFFYTVPNFQTAWTLTFS